jgi:hypothetical protein
MAPVGCRGTIAMNPLFAASYIVLCGLMLLELLVLREALRETVWFKRFYSDFGRGPKWEGLRSGDRAPQFSAAVAETGDTLQSSDLQGHPTVLVFVSPRESPSPLYKGLGAVIHALWHRADRHVYLVCEGDRDSCSQFTQAHLDGFPQRQLLLDCDGSIARDFRIKSMPQAVELDQEVRVKRYGKPKIVEAQGEENLHTPKGNNSDRNRKWPDDRAKTGAAYARVDTSLSCVLTRFRLNSPLSLIGFYLAFRRVRQASRDIDGLLQALFLVEDLRTCYTLSIWKDELAIVDFGNVRAHVDAANSAFNPTYRRDLKRAEIWSAQFRLWGVSDHNLNWEGFDLKRALGTNGSDGK